MNYILGVNIDHVATLRNARSEGYPNVVELALLAQESGAHQITAHLREDRRHIKDEDILKLKEHLKIPLNMEMAVTEEMLAIAKQVKPYSVCLVPEKRNEITTEGGLNIHDNYDNIAKVVSSLKQSNIKISLFVDPNIEVIKLAKDLQVEAIEINTGKYANTKGDLQDMEVENIKTATALAKSYNIKVHAGHGLNLDNIAKIAKIKDIVEFNIGHFLISYALIVGLRESIGQIKMAIEMYRQ